MCFIKRMLTHGTRNMCFILPWKALYLHVYLSTKLPMHKKNFVGLRLSIFMQNKVKQETLQLFPGTCCLRCSDSVSVLKLVLNITENQMIQN